MVELRDWTLLNLETPGRIKLVEEVNIKEKALPGFEPGISCLLDRRFNP